MYIPGRHRGRADSSASASAVFSALSWKGLLTASGGPVQPGVFEIDRNVRGGPPVLFRGFGCVSLCGSLRHALQLPLLAVKNTVSVSLDLVFSLPCPLFQPALPVHGATLRETGTVILLPSALPGMDCRGGRYLQKQDEGDDSGTDQQKHTSDQPEGVIEHRCQRAAYDSSAYSLFRA